MLKGLLKNKENDSILAIQLNDKSITYKDLFYKSAYFSTKIETQKPLVGFYTSEDEFNYIAILSILFSGHGFIPLNYKFPDERLNYIIETTQIDCILVREEDLNQVQSRLSEAIKIISYNNQNSSSCEFEIKLPKSSALAYILFTSGSTGIPKGIPITFNNLEALLIALDNYYQGENINSILQAFEFSFDVSIACTFFAWERGKTIHPVPLNKITPLATIKVLNDLNTDFVVLPPSSAIYMENMKLLAKHKFPNIKHTIFTGEALPFKVIKNWKKSAKNSKIYNGYGPTENTVWSFFYTCSKSTENELVNGIVPIGKPLYGFEYFIKDNELFVKGPQVADKYWRNDEKSQSTFIKIKNDTWYKTGDLVIENKFNNIVYINRIDNQVQINGYRVELGEIEYKLKMITKSSLVCVIIKEDKDGLIQLHAFIEAENININELKKSIAKGIPTYMQPYKYWLLSKMPINNSGKIDRVKLKDSI